MVLLTLKCTSLLMMISLRMEYQLSLFAGLGCRTLRFAKPLDGIALHGHVIENISINMGNDEVRLECRVRCLMEITCVSINIGPPASDSARLCQLSNSDHIRHPQDLKPQEGFLYWVTKVRNDSRLHLEC